MLRAVKIRLYPNKEQATMINKLLGCYRVVYNQCLNRKIESYKNDGKSENLSTLGLFVHHELLKDDNFIWLREQNTKVLKQAVKDMLTAYKNFFEQHSGFPKLYCIMLIDDLDKNILEEGFLMPIFSDGIRIIWYSDDELLYRFMLLVFYLLGCFQVRFYQYEVRSANFWVGRETRRFVSFHPIVWNPISILCDIVLDIMNLFYTKVMTKIKVSPRITIDVKDNRAYIIHIRNRK